MKFNELMKRFHQWYPSQKIARLGFLISVILPNNTLLTYAQDLTADPVIKITQRLENIKRVRVPERPFLYVNKEEIAFARDCASKEEWAGKIKEKYVKTSGIWMGRDYEFIKKIIPPKGSIYTYGLGLDLDPVEQKKMKWRGWSDPRHVIAANGIVYPNESVKDDGTGWVNPSDKMKYYFVALANGMTIKQLETVDLPALVNAYLLTGEEKYAERGLWILDAIATIYPYANEGPIDYPGLAPGKPDGGRLDRPYYQSARALMNYANYAEILSMSKTAGKPSLSNPGYTMLKNIEINLLMNGADYCLRMTKSGTGASYELNNGNIDYNRAPLVVGALLGIPEWVEWSLNGPLGFRYAITNTIDINGRYFETGALYAEHTRELLLSTAFFLKRMRLPSYPNGFEAYDDQRFAHFALNFFSGIEVAGRLPLFGDAGPDTEINPEGKVFDRGTLMAALQFYRYSKKKEISDEALQTVSGMLKDMPADLKDSEGNLMRIYKLDEMINKSKLVKNKPSSLQNTMLFDYGTLILRQGEKSNERAALMRFGPTLNHGQADELGLAFYAKGRDFSFDPGYFNTHFRFGFTSTTAGHNLVVVNRNNQMHKPSPGGDLQTWTNGEVLKSTAVNNPQAYADQNVTEYKRRIALINLSHDESYIVDNFWVKGGNEYDYSLHGIKGGKLNINGGDARPCVSAIGSVLSEKVDYSSEMDPNGRVNSYKDKPFYYAPPGGGYGFFSHPSYYKLNGSANLQWSASDGTGHQMYVWHFAPENAELITAQSPKPLQLAYALSHVKVPSTETVRFTSVIHPAAGADKIASAREILPLDGSKPAFMISLKPGNSVVSEIREHYYMASDKTETNVKFEGGLTFSGEEGYLGLDSSGKIISASLTGAGEIKKGDFKITVQPLFEKPLKVLKVENQPLRVLVNAPYDQTRRLAGSVIRLTRPELSRPYVLQVNESKAEGQNSWLILNGSDNIHAVGKVLSFDSKTNTIVTDAPFPHTRPYTYNYSETSGYPRGDKNLDYNGGYNGFWLVSNQKQRALIKTLEQKRTQIILNSPSKAAFQSGDTFEIQLLAPGDLLEVPVWGEAKFKSGWQMKGSGKVDIEQAAPVVWN
jgi:hypothetical protein